MNPTRWLLLLVAVLMLVAALWWWQPALFRQAFQQIDQQVSGESTLYRWKTPSGRVQITDQPPPGDTPYQQLNYRHDVNVIPETESR